MLARHPAARQLASAAGAGGSPPPAMVPWQQPYPDELLEPIAPSEAEPDAAVVARETIELAFLAAIQHLPPRQRAVLILRDVLGWPAKETATLLESSVASVNSALQRARPTLKEHLPARRPEWAPSSDPSEEERVVLQRYMDAIERADDGALAAVLREDARVSQQPGAGGRDVRSRVRRLRVPRLRARRTGGRGRRGGGVTVFVPDLFPAFGLPLTRG